MQVDGSAGTKERRASKCWTDEPRRNEVVVRYANGHLQLVIEEGSPRSLRTLCMRKAQNSHTGGRTASPRHRSFVEAILHVLVSASPTKEMGTIDQVSLDHMTPRPARWSRTRRLGSTLLQAGKEFVANDPFSQAAAIAYYTIFSLPAVLIITVMVAATVYDASTVREALLAQAGKLIGATTALSLRDMLTNAQITETRFFVKVLGVVALIVSAGSVFASLQSALNGVWGVKAKPGRAVGRYLTTRLLSLALLGSFGFLMLVSLVLDTALVAFSGRLSLWLSEFTVMVVAVLNLLISFGVITLVFAMIFKVLPDARIRWRDVISGAIITALLFTLGKYLIGSYISLAGVGDTYGAAGAVVIILVWVYYSTVIMIYGAHFTHVHTRDHGAGVVPSAHATIDQNKKIAAT